MEKKGREKTILMYPFSVSDLLLRVSGVHLLLLSQKDSGRGESILCLVK